MRLAQQNCEENSLASAIAHFVFLAFVVVVANDGHVHPITSLYFIAAFLIINIPKIFLIYFGKNKSYEEKLASALILANAKKAKELTNKF